VGRHPAPLRRQSPVTISLDHYFDCRGRIRELAHLHAFISLTAEQGEGPLVGVKDLVDVRGTATTAGAVILPPEPLSEDAPLVASMRTHGCVVLGKTNLHEFAFGVTSRNPHYGDVLNPRDPARVAGGSSGGSAVAVATGMCDWAVGSDTGGSIRIPASLCGVVGFKPTYGAVSALGVVPLARSLDTLGPLAPDVATAARALEMMGGPVAAVDGAPRRPGEFRVGVPAGWVRDVDGQVGRAWADASAGVPEVPVPERLDLARCGLTILYAEAAAFHEQWLRTVPEKYSADVRGRLERARETTDAEYREALAERERLQEGMARAMEGLDALLLPATAIVAPLLEQEDVRSLLDCFTRPFNTTGQPVICLPAPSAGLPVGIQVVGHAGREAELVEVARAVEAAWA
jgi:Asp-tRNA(Asn)/Glu-tRNA(Gln) amidotransferase A subunit family amidase